MTWALTWNVIRLPQGSTIPIRINPAVTPLNESQIYIIGGTAYGNKFLSDVLMFDIEENTLTTEIEHGYFKCRSIENQAEKIATDHIAAIV